MKEEKEMKSWLYTKNLMRAKVKSVIKSVES